MASYLALAFPVRAVTFFRPVYLRSSGRQRLRMGGKIRTKAGCIDGSVAAREKGIESLIT